MADPLSIGLGIGKLVLGGLFQRKAERRARAQAIDDQINGPSRMVEGAKKAGLNPLTLLPSSSFGYGQIGGGGAPALASQQLVNSVFNTVQDSMAQKQERELAEKEHALEQERIDLLKARSGGAGGVVQRTHGVTVGPSVQTYAPGQPQAPALPGSHPLPTMVDRNDGLPGANPEAPVQPEEDVWTWGRNGILLPSLDEVIRRNMPPNFEVKTSEPLNPMLKPAYRFNKKMRETLKEGDWPTGKPNFRSFAN